MTPIMSGCGMADLMCRDCSYNAFKPSHKHVVTDTWTMMLNVQLLFMLKTTA